MNIVNVGYDSTNYYVVAGPTTRLLIDVGWPGTLPKLCHQLKVKGLALPDIHYLLCTHYHPDHAGLAQEVKQHGVRLLVLDEQRAAVSSLRQFMKPSVPYQDIRLDDTVCLSTAASRAFLQRYGIAGEILSTPGHTDDSVSLALDTGVAFTGDLPAPLDSDEAQHVAIARSWKDLWARGVRRVYPGHGPMRSLEEPAG